MHQHLREAVATRPDVQATFIDIPRPGLARRLVGARVPGLARLDVDLQPTRAQLAAAVIARRLVRHAAPNADAVHWYTYNSALLCTDLVRARPSIVGVDMTNVQNDQRLPYRSP